MTINETRTMAKSMGINTAKMKKSDMIRAIQRAEHNPDCYATPRVGDCGEDVCWWRKDCVSLNEKKPVY